MSMSVNLFHLFRLFIYYNDRCHHYKWISYTCMSIVARNFIVIWPVAPTFQPSACSNIATLPRSFFSASFGASSRSGLSAVMNLSFFQCCVFRSCPHQAYTKCRMISSICPHMPIVDATGCRLFNAHTYERSCFTFLAITFKV